MTVDEFMAEVDRQIDQMGDEVVPEQLEIIVPARMIDLFYQLYLEMRCTQIMADRKALPLNQAQCMHEFARTASGGRCTRCGWVGAFEFNFSMPPAIQTDLGPLPVRLGTGKDLLLGVKDAPARA